MLNFIVQYGSGTFFIQKNKLLGLDTNFCIVSMKSENADMSNEK